MGAPLNNVLKLSDYREGFAVQFTDVASKSCPLCHGAGFTLVNDRQVSCEPCDARAANKRYQSHAMRSRDHKIIDREWLKELCATNPEIHQPFLKLGSDLSSCLIVSDTGRGKTLALKYAYNLTLRNHKGWTQKILFAKEYHLWALFREEENAETFFEDLRKRKPTHIFLDECFRPNDWRDIHSERDKAKLAHLFMYAFWDWIYESANELVFVTGNQEPEFAIPGTNENERALLRRIRLMTNSVAK